VAIVLTIGVGNAWGATITINKAAISDLANNNYDKYKDAEKDFTVSTVTFKGQDIAYNAKKFNSTTLAAGQFIQMKKTTGHIVNKDELSLSSLVITYYANANGVVVTAGTTSGSLSSVTGTSGSETVTLNKDGGGTQSVTLTKMTYDLSGKKYVRINGNGTNALYIHTITITTVSGTAVSLSKAATTNGSFKLRSESCSGSELSGTPPTVTTTSSSQTVYIDPTPNDGYQVNTVTSELGDAAAVTVSKSGDCYPVTYAQGASGTAVITVTFACATPTFGTNLSTSQVDYTQNASASALTVAATANGGTITYQWQSSSDNSSWSNIGGATSASYTPPTTSTGTTYYHCIATNTTGGDCTATSNAAKIVVTAATCTDEYTFDYGGTKQCFSQVDETNEFQITGFTIPTTTTNYWVGYNGAFYNDNLGTGSPKAKSANNQFKYMPVANLQGQSCGGEGEYYKHAAAGAYGTLRIFRNSSADNLYIGFVPAGYQMRVGSGESWSNIQLTQSDGTVWTSDLMTLDAALIAKNYYVNVYTGANYSSGDAGVAINNWTNGGSTISSMAFKTGSDSWDTSTGLSAGMRGKFRAWSNNCANNGYCHFVPYYQLQYNPVSSSGTGTGSMSPLPATPISCEESSVARTVTVATSSFTAPQYKQFDHWNTAADNSGSNVSTGSYTLTGDVTLYAQWVNIPVTALTLNYSTLKKYVGESDVTLSVASVTPGTANPAVTWTSSDATVASVDGGVVSFLKAGTATITATSTVSGGVTATCSVEVRSISSPTMQDEDGTTITSGDGKPSATWTLGTRTLTASEGTSLYKFKRWIVTNATPASTTNLSTTLGDPTGNVTVVAEFYKPRTVTKGTGTGTSTFTVSPTGEVKHGSSVTVTCAATDGYKNPWTLTVTPSDGATYDETGSTGSITISNITKNITVDLAYVDKGCTDHYGTNVVSGSSSTSATYGPVYATYNYGTRQILYTKTDLDLAVGKKGTIKSIYFDYNGGAAMAARTIKIYMANTSLTALSKSNYVPYASFTQVYSGTFSCSSAGWYEIVLNTPFEYNGAGSLVVLIDDNSGSYEYSKYFNYHTASTTAGALLYTNSDTKNEDPATTDWSTYTPDNNRPNTKFCIEEDDMVEATVNWYVNGSIEHTQTDYPGTAFDEIPTPVSGDCDGEKEFVGWYTDDYTHASVAPAFVNPTVIPEGGADYYAVFATVTPTNNYQQITSEGDLVAGAKYLIVGNSSTTYNALPVDAATSLISVSPSGTPLTISSPGSTLIWTLEGSADAWKIKSTSNNKYLQISGGDLTFETSTSLTFSVGVSSNIFTFTSSAASGNKILSYYHKNTCFNAFTGPNNVYVFKQVVNATNYATTCAETYNVTRAGSPAGTVTGGTFTVSPSKQAEGKTVTLSATPDLGYAFGSWTVTKTESPYTDITSTNVAGNTLTMPAYGVTVNATFTPTPTLTATGGDLSSTTLPFGTSCEQDEGTDKTFVLNGYSLTNNVTLTIGGTDASMFSVKSPSSPISKGTGRITDQTVTVTFTPTSTGAKTATLTIASSGASSIVLTLSGTAIKHYKVHYWNSGTDVHQESVLAGSDASATWDGVGDNDGCDTEEYKYFVGWSKTNVGSTPTTTKPTIGGTYTSLSSDVNYYAVWTNVNPGGWERYESSTLAEGDYLVVQQSSTTYYTMKNTQVGSNPYRMDHGVAVFSGSLISAPSSELSYDWNDFIWHIAESSTSGYYTIYNADESKYIAATGVAKDIAFVASPADNKELFSFTYNSTSKTYNWTSKYNTDNSVNAHFRDGNSGWACYAAQTNNSYLYYRPGGTAKYITNCCDKNVTLATNSPANGTITFSPEGTIGTCGADAASRQTTMTVTPDEGYYLSTWSTSGVAPTSVSPEISYGTTADNGAQATTVTFTQNATGTYTANATFSQIMVNSLSLRAQQTGQDDKVGNDLTMNCYPKEGQTGGNDPLSHTLNVQFGEVLPSSALDKTYDWSVRVKTKDGDWTDVGFTGNALNTNSIINSYNKSTGNLQIKTTEGTAEIKITAHDGSGITAKVTITVANVALSSLNVAKSSTTLYVGESEQIAVTYDPVNTTTKGYTTGSYTYVTIGNTNAIITLTGKAATSEVTERVTLTSKDAGAKTATIDVTVKPLPKVTFVDIVHNKTDFTNWGTDGVVSSTVTDGVVTHTKPTPSHADISDPGASYNACERSHLHLVGWIESTWADAHPSATHEQIVGANVSNGAGTFLEAGADLNVETYNGNTYYAVWSKIE
jgi:hypothetical protein